MLILVINPGSTSTKIAVFDNETEKLSVNIAHSVLELSKFSHIIEQFEFRKQLILKILRENGFSVPEFSAVVGRGGLLEPLKAGTYRVNDKMLKELTEGRRGEHASNLGAILADEIATSLGIPAFIVDPVVVDEMDEVARISGIPDIRRRSVFHALNHKRVARIVADKMGKSYDRVNLIVAHLGGGISMGAHKKGKVIDVNNAVDGDGPFTPERAGGLPVWDIVELALSGKYSKEKLKKHIIGEGGLIAYLGTNDIREVKKMIKQGNHNAELVYKAMAYQVAKEIGVYATVLKGDVDAIILTGGVVEDINFVNLIKERVRFISQIIVYPGNDEMAALAEGVMRVLKGEENAKIYE